MAKKSPKKQTKKSRQQNVYKVVKSKNSEQIRVPTDSGWQTIHAFADGGGPCDGFWCPNCEVDSVQAEPESGQPVQFKRSSRRAMVQARLPNGAYLVSLVVHGKQLKRIKKRNT